MRKALFIIILTGVLLLHGCATSQLQAIHDDVYSKFEPISDMEMWGARDYKATREERWIEGKIYGDCDEFATEVYERAQAQGLNAEYVELWRNEGDMINGYSYKGHAVVILDGYVSDNRFQWVFPEKELWEKWNLIKTEGVTQNDIN